MYPESGFGEGRPQRLFYKTEGGNPMMFDGENLVVLPIPEKRLAVFYRAADGSTVCWCGWGHGKRYDPWLELLHRIEHIEKILGVA